MDPASLLVLGALAYGVLQRRAVTRAPAPVQPPAAPAPGPAGALPAVPALPALPAIPAAVSSALVVAAKVAGTAVAATGAALGANELGAEIDRALGGDGRNTGGALALRGGLGGTAFVGVALAGLSILKVATIALTTAFAATGIGLLITAAVWIIAVVFEDIAALSFGQPGAFRELEVQQRNTRDQLYFEARKEMSDDEAVRVSEQAAVGYISAWNRLRYETWMRRKWGPGVTRGYHAKWGRDRGHFVGWTSPEGDLFLDKYAKHDVPFPGKALDTAWVRRYVPAAERTQYAGVYRRARTYTKAEKDAVVASFQTTAGKLALSKSLVAGAKSVSTGGVFYTTVTEWEEVPTTLEMDSLFDTFAASGRMLANVIAYVKWMAHEQRGLGASDAFHAAAGLREGRFQGEVSGSRLKIAVPGSSGAPVYRFFDFKSQKMTDT